MSVIYLSTDIVYTHTIPDIEQM